MSSNTSRPIFPALPGSPDAERSILGAILLTDGRLFADAASKLGAEDFILDSHRRLFARMGEMRGPIDLVTLSNALADNRELDAIGGAGYLASLTDGLPRLENIDFYIEIVKQKSSLRRIVAVSNHTASRALDPSENPEEIAADAQRVLAELSVGGDGGLTSLNEIYRQDIGSLDELSGQGERTQGILTGFRQFDRMTCGLHRGEMTVIAARPSMGKTALALNIAAHVARSMRETVAIFSLEMTRKSVLTRILNAEARVNGHRLRSGMAVREDYARLSATLGQLMEWPIFVDDRPAIRPETIVARARALKARMGTMALVVVDYLQLIDAGAGRNDNRVQEVSRISRAMLGMAKSLDCPVLALSQLNRAIEDRGGRPRLSDLRESGQIEQDAHTVCFLWKENAEAHRSRRDGEAAVERGHHDGETNLSIEKQRNGPTGDVRLIFISGHARFENAADPFDNDAAQQEAQRRLGEA